MLPQPACYQHPTSLLPKPHLQSGCCTLQAHSEVFTSPPPPRTPSPLPPTVLTTTTPTPPPPHKHSPLPCTRPGRGATTPQCRPPQPCQPAQPAEHPHGPQQRQQWHAPAGSDGCCCLCSGCTPHTPCTCENRLCIQNMQAGTMLDTMSKAEELGGKLRTEANSLCWGGGG